MNELLFRLKEFFKHAAEIIKENPLIAVIIAIFALLLVFAWVVFLALVILVAIFSIILKISFSPPSLRELFRKKRALVKELNITEKKFMKHEISKEDYDKFFMEKQSELIEVEAQIEEKYGSIACADEAPEIAAKKRHALRELLSKKKTLVNEMKIAQVKYLKRQISEGIYKKIMSDSQREAIRLEAQISGIYSEDRVEKAMGHMKEEAKKVQNEEKEETRTKENAESEESELTVSEIYEQTRK